MKNASRISNYRGLLWIVLAFLSGPGLGPESMSRAATYYVDGNDPAASNANPGTEAQPWKTISKATPLVQPGDTVFVKAGTYRETVILTQSGTATAPITLAAYPGQEGKAILDAAEPVWNWIKCTGPAECSGNPQWSHLYYADVAGVVAAHPDKAFAIRQVFQHGRLLPRSRYPNTGWSYPTSVANPKTTFSDSTLAKPRAYFNGAVCHLKTALWQMDQIPIAGSLGPTITLAASPLYDISTRFGYYITSVVGEINEEGKWAYDPTSRRLYLWPRGGVPEEVEFTYREYCLRTYDRVSFNVVRGLTMRHPYQYGIFLYLANNMTIENNTVEHAYTFGIHLQATGGPCDDNQIVRNTVKYSCFRGINVGGGSARCNLEGNTVYATGVEHFGEDLMNGSSHGVYVNGAYQRVYDNRIDRTGGVGLYLHGEARGREVSYNYITNSGLAVSDTGGIYTGSFADGPGKDHIHHNIIEDTLGCRTMDKQYDVGTPPTIETYSGDASGIYVDEEGNHRLIEDNTVIGARFAGIFLHWAPGNLVQRNTLYGNKAAQVWLSGKNGPRTALLDDVFLDNILFATEAQQNTLHLAINYDDVRFGQSDRNGFYNPYGGLHLYVSRYPAQGGTLQETMALRGWRILSGYDGNSLEFPSPSRFPGLTIRNPVQSRIVYNPSLDVTTVDLGADQYCDVQGNKVYGKVSLQPCESKILIVVSYETATPALPR